MCFYGDRTGDSAIKIRGSKGPWRTSYGDENDSHVTECARPGDGEDQGPSIEGTSCEGKPMGERSEEEQRQWHRKGAAAWDSNGSSELLVARSGA